MGPTNHPSATEILIAEARTIAETSLYYAEVYYAAETPWFYLRYWFGIPSTILATAAGAIAFLKFPGNEVIAGGFSFLVAALSALYVALDPMAKGSAFHDLATAYEVLYHDIGFFLRFHAAYEKTPHAELRLRVQALHDRLTALQTIRLPVSARAYRIAEEIQAGRRNGEVKRDSNAHKQGGGNDA